ncbi:MAG TPA: DUF11 domain-containing protein [Saprospiraceae bacterium]|nr:DUF11 domain-containing protein [Saprospiraceae bacterium]
MKKIFTLFFLSLPFLILAQAENTSIDLEQTARQYLENHLSDWDLRRSDISDVALVNRVFTKHNKVTSLYFNQQSHGIELYNAVYNISLLPSGKVLLANNRFYKNIENRVGTATPVLHSDDALRIVFKDFGLPSNAVIPAVKERKDNYYRYDKGDVAIIDMASQLRYFPQGEQFKLVWDIIVEPVGQSELWSIKVDAVTGKILEKRSMTIHCSFEPGQFSPTATTDCTEESHRHFAGQSRAGADGSSYNVLPYDVESPIYGSHALITDPADLGASPYGWHDTDGQDGAEFTITRGNNAHAYLDLDNTGVSSGDEPDGGATLTFDFPYDSNSEASVNRDAAVTNLFYMNNFMHDFTFFYGFDEDAGNFQEKNYAGPDFKAHDYVLAQGQDGSGTNNANFSTPLDGYNGQMQMYVWVGQGAKYLNVTSPAGIAGVYATGTAEFGTPVSDIPVSGDIVLINDGSIQNPTLGCAQTSQDLTDKIAMVDRGDCYFAEKAIFAQNAGAIGLIVANFNNGTGGMTAPSNLGSQVHIPLLMISSSDAGLIKSSLANDNPVSASIVKNQSTGPDSLDSDFDNGVIAHEYGHGISTRLTGSGQNVSCLFNDEQMGEGWSDFFALVTSAKSTDTGAEARGIGNYVIAAGVNGTGIRRFPYSTDMSICPLTYYDILNTTAPHPLGEVWTACLWDMYWMMVERYGFSDDIYHGNKGNNMAIQLVIDGMKFQSCSPGFIDGRDGILAADMANNNGANQCLIWEAFARRGLGVSASEGSPDDRNDGKEAYDTPLACAKELGIKKEVTPVINAGDVIDVTLKVYNYKGEDLTGVTVTDMIPSGTSYVAGSASSPASVVGETISFDLGNVADQTDLTITYQLNSDPDNKSISLWNDDFETDDARWNQESVEGDNYWDWESSSLLGYAHSGAHSFYIEGATGSSDQTLFLLDPITISGAKPILRFFHRYDTKPGEDGGIVELSSDNGLTWHDAGERIFRNKYTGKIDYSTFVIPNQQAFWGISPSVDSAGYIETMVDLSDFVGSNFNVRWHFASGATDSDLNSVIWSVDDVEFMDMLNYDTEVCVSSSEGDQACAKAKGNGTVVNSNLMVDVNDVNDPSIGFEISPNPAGDFVNVRIQSEFNQEATIAIVTLEGKTIVSESTRLNVGSQSTTIGTRQLAAGLYFVKIQTPKGLNIQKLIIQ